MVRTSTLARVAALLVAFGLAACGGGGGGGSSSGGSTGRTSGYAGDPKIEFFNVTPTTIEQGDTFTVSWTVDPDTVGLGTYTAELHLNTEPRLPTTDSPLGPIVWTALSRVFSVNGSTTGVPGMEGTDVDITMTRSAWFGYDAIQGGSMRQPYTLATHFPNATTLYAVLRVCALQADLKTHCTVTEGDAAVKLTFPPAQ